MCSKKRFRARLASRAFTHSSSRQLQTVCMEKAKKFMVANKHRPDMIVGRDIRHAQQRLAIGGLAAFGERSLIGEERLRLHEEQGKSRQADIGHRIVTRALPLVGKGRAGVMQPGEEAVENQHPHLKNQKAEPRKTEKAQLGQGHLELLRSLDGA